MDEILAKALDEHGVKDADLRERSQYGYMRKATEMRMRYPQGYAEQQAAQISARQAAEAQRVRVRIAAQMQKKWA